MALETVAFCTVPYDRVLDLAASVPGLWSALMRGAANHIVDAEQHAMLLGQRTAPARLRRFFCLCRTALQQEGAPRLNSIFRCRVRTLQIILPLQLKQSAGYLRIFSGGGRYKSTDGL
jgi:CRP-like cAMP-binding protein